MLEEGGFVLEEEDEVQLYEHGFRVTVTNGSLKGDQRIGPITVDELRQSIKAKGHSLEGLLRVTCEPHGARFLKPVLLDFPVIDQHISDVLDEFGRCNYEVRVCRRLPRPAGECPSGEDVTAHPHPVALPHPTLARSSAKTTERRTTLNLAFLYKLLKMTTGKCS